MAASFTHLFRSRSPWITILGAGALWTVLIFGFAALGQYYAQQEFEKIALGRAKHSFQKELSDRLWAMERGSLPVPLSASEFGASQEHWRVTILSLASLWVLGLGAIGFWAFRTGRLEEAKRDALSSLEESRSLYQSLAENLPASLFRRDLEDRLVYANPPMLKDLGESKDAFGLRPQDCHPPEEAEVIAGENRRALAGETLRLVRPYRIPSTGEQQVREVVKSPVRNHAGDIVGLQGISWDVTERVRKDEAILRHLEQYQAVIQTAADGFLQIGSGGEIMEVNEAYCAVSGYSRDELIGRPIYDLVADGSTEEMKSCLQRVRDEGFGVFQMQHRAKDGRRVEFEISLSFVPSWNFCVLFLRDVTGRLIAAAEKQRLEAELLHMQKLDSLGRLAGGVAHDMNNILASIMALGSVLAMRHKADSGIQKDAADLLNAARRGRDLVKGLTQFARKELAESVPQDLNQIVRQEAELLARTTLKAVEVVLDIDESLGKVRCDGYALSNALMNLCVNALDAMAGKGRLRLATRNLPPDQVELVVEDNGEGMSPDTLARAMEPFFTTKPIGKGTGLGLSMVYGAVKSHGGTLDLQSAPGRGTRVVIHLPSTGTPAAAHPTESLAASASSGLAVLLVDDDELVLATLPLMLEGQGHRVTTASSGAEALRRLQAGLEAQLLILDMNMPGMDGLETLGRVRMLRPHLPVLVATGNDGDPRIEGILSRDGRTALLPKPFSFDELQQKIAAFLS